jgi:hypothetical protein
MIKKILQRDNLLAVALLLLLTVGVFGRAVLFDFVNLDDNSNLKKNPAMQDISLAWSKPYLDAYLPVVYTVWNGLHHLAHAERPRGDSVETFTPIPELDPWPFHVTNVVLHALNGVLMFLILRSLFPAPASPITAGLLAALFVVHPLQVEPVAWVTALKDVLSGFFSLLLVLLYVQKPLSDYRDRQDVPRMILLSAVLLLACFSKSTRIFLPLFLLPLGHLHWRKPLVKIAADLWPLFVVSALVMVLAMAVQPPPKDMAYQEIWRRPFVASDALFFYVWKLFWPSELALDYGRNPRFLFESGQVWWFFWVPLVVASGWWFARKRIDPWLQLGVAGFVLGLLPLLGLMPFVFQTISTVSDRYCYLSIALLLIGVTPALLLKPILRVAQFVLLLLVIVCAVLSYRQLPVWQNSYALWQHTLTVTPESGIANNNIASIYEELGQTEKAIEYYEASYERLPRADLCSRIAILYTDLGQWQKALEWIDKGLQLAPEDGMLLQNRAVVVEKLKPRSFRVMR